MLVVYPKTRGKGWGSVHYLARLAAELLDAQLLEIEPNDHPSRIERLPALLGRSRGTEHCLVIAPNSNDCSVLPKVPNWNRRFKVTAAWVIDSFWPNRVTRLTRMSRMYDLIYVSTETDIPSWQKMMGTPVSCLPFGTDVWRMGSANDDRPVDLLRVGRQPRDWDDNTRTAAACESVGLQFNGSPPFASDVIEAQKTIHRYYATCKFALAFSNVASPANYVHPTRQYLTARWTDSLASGAIVAGIPPREPDIDRILWPGAILELPGVTMAEGLPVLRQAVSDWRPEQAVINHRMALERFDWRWRLVKIADDLGLPATRLRAELKAIQRKLASPWPVPQLAQSISA